MMKKRHHIHHLASLHYLYSSRSLISLIVNIFACSGIPLSLVITLQFFVCLESTFISSLFLPGVQSQQLSLSGVHLQIVQCFWWLSYVFSS